MKGFRKGIGIFLINEKNQLWVGKRIDFKNDYWQMPQGPKASYDSRTR